MAKEFKVYGIGNAIMDYQVQLEEEEFQQLNLEKGQMRLVETAEQAALIKQLDNHKVQRSSGGSVANSMIVIASLGSNTVFSCAVGDDNDGKAYVNEMEKLNIKCLAQIIPSEPTGSSVVLVTPDSERTMNTHLGASALFQEEGINETVLRNSEWLFIEGYLLSTENGRSAANKAIKLAQQADVKIALSLSDSFIVNCFRDTVEEITNISELVFANQDEAKSYTNQTEDHSAYSAFCNSTKNCVMTMGEKGAKAYFSGKSINIDPYPTEAVDATGAGDIFAGTFLNELSNGEDPLIAGKRSCYLAGRIVSQMGARLQGNPREILKEGGLL